MRDLVKLAVGIDPTLSAWERRLKLCELLLEELKTLKGIDLEPYLSEFVFDQVVPGVRIELKFPVGAHVIDSNGSQIKSNGV